MSALLPHLPAKALSRRFWFGLVVVLVASTVCHGEAAIAPEVKLKAAYVIKLSQYVTWPDSAPAETSGPLRVGATEAGGLIDELVRQARTLRGKRPIEIVPLTTLEDALSCHVLFFGSNDTRAITDWVPTVRTHPLLTISDHPETIAAGMAIRLVKDSQTLRFEINQPAVDTAKLEVNPEAVRYAKHVHGRKEEAR
ncbi:MAG: YfiR family protein [Opitutaceae bacterium]|nr:YfiR family protein [Opitutaceae bacterium]